MDLCSILEGCLAGKTRYRKLFYEQFYAYALKIAFRYVHQQDEAAVLVNDSFAKMLLDPDSFKFQNRSDIETAVKNSIKKIVVYNAIDKLFNTFAGSANNSTKISFSLSDKDQNNFYGQIISLLASLPPWHRVLFNMHIIDGFSLFEIAEHFEISVSDCMADLVQAKSFLKKLMNKEETFSQPVEQSISIAR